MHRLDKAGYAVKKASEDLTKAAKDAREAKEDSQVRFKVFSKKILKFKPMKKFPFKISRVEVKLQISCWIFMKL